MNLLTFHLVSLVGIFSFFQWQIVVCTRHDVHEMMYWELNSSAACFRRLNATHQTGCSSNKGGNVGIIHILKNGTDFPQNNNDKYVIVLYVNMLNSDIADKLIKQTNVAGVLVLVEKDTIPPHYSPDDVCPNSLLSPCRGSNVNKYGNKFLFYDWPFPMFMVDDEKTIKTITTCYNTFNLPFGLDQSSRPLCSIQMKSHMFAAVNTPTCLRRTSTADFNEFRYCDAMGDQNIILPMEVFDQNIPERSVIIIAARLDAASLFDGISPGALTSVTGIVTLLSTANILYTLLKTYEGKAKHIMFVFLNGESYDYIGSSRLIYDIKNGNFQSTTSMNLTMENIMLLLEISQIDSNSEVFIHKTNNLVVDTLSQELIDVGSKHKLHISLSTRKDLPPSSLHMFIKADPKMPALLISNFNEEYNNNYYNGFIDNANSIKYKYGENITGSLQKNIAALSSTIASSVYKTLTGSPKDVDEDNFVGLVDDLLHCYLDTRLCKLIKEVLNGNEENFDDNKPLPLYVGVDRSLNPITSITGLLLANLTSDPLKIPKDNCSATTSDKPFSYIWIHGPNNTGLCLNTTLKFMQAKSPAFLIDDYDWLSGNYSTWTESVWNEIGLVIFMKPSRYQEYITFSTGVLVFIVSFGLVFWLTRKSNEVLFNPSSMLITSC